MSVNVAVRFSTHDTASVIVLPLNLLEERSIDAAVPRSQRGWADPNSLSLARMVAHMRKNLAHCSSEAARRSAFN